MPLPVEWMTSSPLYSSESFSGTNSRRLSLSEVIGLMEFMISWVSTQVREIHESISLLSNSLCMSLITPDNRTVHFLELVQFSSYILRILRNAPK
ncbi:MAG: hypothetical protein K5882_01995 [Bacteroidales bacterium]|nr:hypothetical protein [Bacteroidales bacterium]